MPFGFGSGGGVIFGVTGGVTEAVLRRLSPDHSKEAMHEIAECGVRGEEGIKEFYRTVQGNGYQCMRSQWPCKCKNRYGTCKERRGKLSSDRGYGMPPWMYHGWRSADQIR